MKSLNCPAEDRKKTLLAKLSGNLKLTNIVLNKLCESNSTLLPNAREASEDNTNGKFQNNFIGPIMQPDSIPMSEEQLHNDPKSISL